MVTVAVADPGEGRTPPPVAVREAALHTLTLRSDGADRRGVDPRGTKPFSLLGISWPRETAAIEGRAEVRTRSAGTGEWTGWQALGLEIEAPETVEGAESQARGATEPLWVGPADGVEARVVAEDGTASEGLPDGLRLDLVDPGVTREEAKEAGLADGGGAQPLAMEAAAFGTEVTPSPPAAGTEGGPGPEVEPEPAPEPEPEPVVPVAPPSSVTRPPVVPRSAWGADESLVADPVEYVERVDAAFVHHTTNANAYSCAETPAILRGLMTYHVESNGWNDLGYNFLVDKCGTVYEGRGGGTDLPVLGAHTYGFNSYSTGIAVIGNHATDGRPSPAVTNAVARVAAWKLGQYGVSPTGRVTLEAKEDTGVWKKGQAATLNTVSGHRDGFATECPGDALYAKLGEIRRFAASPAASSAAPTSDVHRDGITDLLTGMPDAERAGDAAAGMVSLLPGGTDGPVPAGVRALDQESPGVSGGSEAGDRFGESAAYGDVNGDGHADLVVGSPGEEHSSATDHGIATVLDGPGLATARTLKAPASEETAGARFGSAVTVADVDSDGHADVVVVAPGKPGRWHLFDGETLAHRASGYLNTSAHTGDSAYPDLTSGDFDRDGYTDIAASYRDPSAKGRLLVLRGSKDGLVRQGILATAGGRSVSTGDTDGDGYTDLVVGQPYTSESGARAGGQVTVLRGSSGGLTSVRRVVLHQDSPGVPGGSEDGDAFGYSVSAGDVNGDGRADVLAGAPLENLTRDGVSRADAGYVHLLYGSSSGLTGSGSTAYSQDSSGIPGVTESGDRFGYAVQLADVSGWGRTDLAVAAEGEDTHDGGVTAVPAGSSGVDTGAAAFLGRSAFRAPADARVGRTLAP